MSSLEGRTEEMECNEDSSTTSSDDDEEDKALLLKAEDLERQIADNKFFYNGHEELVKLYHKIGDLTSMRLSYERFKEHFPLTPEIWLEWINVERKLGSTPDEIKNVFSLFEQAVEDYLSVNLWVEYAQYAIGASTVEETRCILEKGLQAAGLHASQGSLLWDTLRELELAHLACAPQGTEAYTKQLHRVVEVFRRQLSVPLLEMHSTYAEWQEFTAQVYPELIKTEPIEWGYKKALKTLDSYKPFEDKLHSTSDETELERIYIDYAKTTTDPSTVLCIFERGAAQLCLRPTFWEAYCTYASKFNDAAGKISAKALRNCPWSEELWIWRLRVLELTAETSEILPAFEQGLANMGPGQGSELWLSYLEYTIRAGDTDKLQKLFGQAEEQLYYKNDELGYCKVCRLHARVLAKAGDMPGARKVWKEILKSPQNRNNASLWLDFAALERQYGDANQVRTVYQRALTCCKTYQHTIAEEWLLYERETGALTDVIKCVEKVKDVVKILPPEPVPEKKRKLEEAPSDISPKKLRMQPKKTPIVKDPTRTVFVSNLHTSFTEKKLQRVFPNAVNIEVVVDRKGNSRCYGYVQFPSEEAVMVALARDRELLDGRPLFVSECKPDQKERQSAFKYSGDIEENKLFVKGLPYETTEEELSEMFKEFGAVNVRLVRQKTGQSKGLAYVEFTDKSAAEKAVKKTNQSKIGEHIITVAISNPPARVPAQKKSSEPVRHARSKLQVPMVPRVVQVKTGTGGATVAKKSNADFRKMLLNN